MKKLFLIGLLLFGQFAFADEWPWDPACRRVNARSETFTFEDNPNEKVVMCLFGLRSYVDRASVYDATYGYHSDAVYHYARNEQFPFGRPCGWFGARVRSAVSTKGEKKNICVFFRSAMEASTFQEGPGSVWNREMDEALRIRPHW